MDRVETVLRVMAEITECDRADLKPEMDLVADLNVDSPKALRLLVELEEQLDIEITDEDAAAMNTVGDILDYVRGLPVLPA